MRRLLLLATLLAVPVLAMAQPPAGTPSTPPTAPKMASDDVMALLEKGEVGQAEDLSEGETRTLTR